MVLTLASYQRPAQENVVKSNGLASVSLDSPLDRQVFQRNAGEWAEIKSIAQVNTYASGNTHARQSFTLYGSSAAADPGWNVGDTTAYTPVITVDYRGDRTEYEVTSIRRSGGKPLGRYRWLVWAACPTLGEIGGQNTTFEEMQVIAAAGQQ